MRVGVAQINCSLGDVRANCSRITLYTEQARDAGCRAIIFPEMIDTGYEMSTIREKASPWDGLPFTISRRAAADFGMYLVCGISERENGFIYNSMAIFDPNGDLLGKYRKVHLFTSPPINEDRCFTPGNSLETVTIEDMKWGFSICYDLRFPEMSRSLVLNGAEVLVVCSAWPFPRDSHWKTLISARAIENQAYLIAANRIGTDGSVTFCGSSCIVDPYGSITAAGTVDGEELIVGEISKQVVTAVRNEMPVFRDRRDDVYCHLVYISDKEKNNEGD